MKILLLAVRASTFVEKDIKILNSQFDVTFHKFNGYSIFQCYKLIKKHDILFLWFASLRFFFPVLLAKFSRKRIIIVAGGYDVRKVDSGSMSSVWKSVLVKIMLRLSDKILAVSKSNKTEIIENCGINSSKIKMIYHGFEEIGEIDLSKKADSILTIGYLDNKSFFRKGIDKFFQLAETLPEYEFNLIGKINIDQIKVKIPQNVILHGYLSFGSEKFNNLLEKAKIYIQFSSHESFGCSVAEAMQFGCIPVVSDKYSLPEVVGNCGIIITQFDNYEEIGKTIEKVITNYEEELSLRCMNYVRNNFGYDMRKNAINEVIQNI